jgi:hypothetical protein
MERRKFDIVRPTKGTCEWVFDHPDYKSWCANEQGLLSIRGNPGVGKSVALKCLAQRAHENKLADDEPTVILSFYFDGRGVDNQKTANGLFRSILHGLLIQLPDLMSDLVESYQNKRVAIGQANKDWYWYRGELEHIIETSIEAILEKCPISMFVDALDESGEDNAVQLVHFFQRLLSKCSGNKYPLSICTACRHFPLLPLKNGLTIPFDGEKKDDMMAYIKERFHLEGIATEMIELQHVLHERAGGVFLWAKLVVDLILPMLRSRANLQVVRKKIIELPAELEKLYTTILESISMDICHRDAHVTYTAPVCSCCSI